MANLTKIVTVPVELGYKGITSLNDALDYSEDAANYLQGIEGTRASRLGMAIKELEEGERMRRDTQNLLTRAKIELRRRMANRLKAERTAMGGLFG